MALIMPEPPAAPPGDWESWDGPMGLALEQAQRAADAGEVPVGAVLLHADGTVLAAEANGPITHNDPSHHAEMGVLRAAGAALGNYRLEGTICVVTLEPCLMCLGALIHARVAGVVYGAPDPKTGAVQSCLDGANLPFFNHRFWVVDGVRAEECGDTLRTFFRARRGA